MSTLVTQEEFSEMMQSAKEDIKARLLEQLKTDAVSSLCWSFRDQAAGIVKEFFEKEMKPELEAKLFADKAELLAVMQINFTEIGNLIGKALLTKATESVANSYDMGRIAEALFK